MRIFHMGMIEARGAILTETNAPDYATSVGVSRFIFGKPTPLSRCTSSINTNSIRTQICPPAVLPSSLCHHFGLTLLAISTVYHPVQTFSSGVS
jgi:hypothetical protein